ncbi:hypothetical protein Droror1_Dr00005214 [Drosera rotundifolia]
MVTSRRWFQILRNKLFFRPRFRRANQSIIIVHNNTSITSNDEDRRSSFVEVKALAAAIDGQGLASLSEDAAGETERRCLDDERDLDGEREAAAIKIQASFRGHLARRAFRALRSLVKLQAVVRGVCVRRQARIALHCMHALVRLQVRVRTRQLLSSSSDQPC